MSHFLISTVGMYMGCMYIGVAASSMRPCVHAIIPLKTHIDKLFRDNIIIINILDRYLFFQYRVYIWTTLTCQPPPPPRPPPLVYVSGASTPPPPSLSVRAGSYSHPCRIPFNDYLHKKNPRSNDHA